MVQEIISTHEKIYEKRKRHRSPSKTFEYKRQQCDILCQELTSKCQREGHAGLKSPRLCVNPISSCCRLLESRFKTSTPAHLTRIRVSSNGKFLSIRSIWDPDNRTQKERFKDLRFGQWNLERLVKQKLPAKLALLNIGKDATGLDNLVWFKTSSSRLAFKILLIPAISPSLRAGHCLKVNDLRLVECCNKKVIRDRIEFPVRVRLSRCRIRKEWAHQ